MGRIKLLMIIVLGSILINNSVIADISSKDYAQCSFVDGSLARLECFDRLAKNKKINGMQPQKNKVKSAGKWQVLTEVNPVDDSKTVNLVLNADSGKSRFKKNINLIIRCQSNKTELYINWQDYLGSKSSVLTRIGTHKAINKRWILSSNSKASFYPKGTISFILKMMKENKFLAQTTPYNESPITAIFDIQGLTKAIKPLRETCGWTDADLLKEAKKAKQQESKKKIKIAEKERQEAKKRLQQVKLQRQAEREAESARFKSDKVRRENRVVNRYAALVQNKITRYWRRPAKVRSKMKCTLNIRMTPSGEVLSVKVVNSSGNYAFDRAAEKAVTGASPLSVPTDKELFNNNFRNLTINYEK
ncbi:MAG: cell envelope integrity protein TolA [Pseudomonadota bacterium]